MNSDLWKYCTGSQCRDFLLSLNLTGNMKLSDEKKLALLYGLANHTQDHYKRVEIPKKTGGFRTLYVPDPVLKYVQRQILSNVLCQFSVSSCATAYQKGHSLICNAKPHLRKPMLLKLDISDFFGSITYISVYQHAFPGEIFPPSARTLLTHLCCFQDMLPQGAPTSPYISNLVLAPFDKYMEKWCRDRAITYTRYCDDMTFSGSFSPGQVTAKVRGFLGRLGFQLNPEKTRVIHQGQRQIVTGIVVNEKAQTAKAYRRRLRQEIYYIEKFGICEHLKNIHSSQTPENYLKSLEGKIRYCLQINPQDVQLLKLWEKFEKIKTEGISES